MSGWGRQVDRMLEDWAGDRLFRGQAGELPFNPSCDVTESKVGYQLRFDLPGVSKDQIKIDLHENTLTVSGERKTERKEGDAENKKHVSEVYYGSFMRSFTFPQTLDPERVDARFENGVLSVELLKKDSPRSRQISVK